MSTKICVTAVKPTWKDAVTIGQLHQMVDALYALGFGNDTPVTYLNDDDHVWLETVNDDDVVIVLEPEPRVWQSLDDVPHDVAVRSAGGEEWNFRDGEFTVPGGMWLWSGHTTNYGHYKTAPFTEILSKE